MKKRNQKLKSLRLNKIKVSQLFGGFTDPDTTSDYCEDEDDKHTDYCHGTTAGSAKTASQAVTRYC